MRWVSNVGTFIWFDFLGKQTTSGYEGAKILLTRYSLNVFAIKPRKDKTASWSKFPILLSSKHKIRHDDKIIFVITVGIYERVVLQKNNKNVLTNDSSAIKTWLFILLMIKKEQLVQI